MLDWIAPDIIVFHIQWLKISKNKGYRRNNDTDQN